MRPSLWCLILLAVVTACGGGDQAAPADSGATTSASTVPGSGQPGGGSGTSVGTTTQPGPTDSGSTGAGPSATPVSATPASTAPLPTRPPWLGQRTLPTDSDGDVPPQTTPAELVDRRFATIDLLAPPADGQFHATLALLADDPLQRSTWNERCPVTVDDLRYLTMSFWGFDGLPHTGEMIVNATVADDIITAFRALFEARYPIEEMRITTQAEVDAPPIGDGNNTSAFVCRAARGSSRFSEHAYGLAVDINPFLNPYQKGDLVLPELATFYTDRASGRPGVITEGDAVVAAFDAIGWGWGGRWSSLKDYQHFSLNNR